MNVPQLLLNKPAPGTRLDLSHPLNKGLVGCWLFNEQSGMQAYDVSPYHNHGTLRNFNDPSSKDRSSLGLQFDGASTYVNCGNGSSLDITDAITLAVWVKKKDTNAGIVIEKGDTNSNGPYYIANVGNKWEPCLKTTTESFCGIGARPTSTFNINQWYHLALVWNGATTILYENGMNIKEGSLSGILKTNTKPFYIGTREGTSLFFNGTIDSVRIYNRALSAEEIKKLYQSPYCMFERGER